MGMAFVLGAGLSHAISPRLPLTDELGNVVRARVSEAAARSARGFTGGYFEAWLSRLAEPQPDLLDHENASNYGLFLRVLLEIHRIVQERQLEALTGEPPWWLRRLIGLMHTSSADVITFNYDTLIEHTLEVSRHGEWPTGESSRAFRLMRDVPPVYRPPATYFETTGETFRLMKLHGSLDTFWAAGDRTGATIQRWESAGGWGDPRTGDEARRRQALPGRGPFIVPPAAAKSSFYSNPVTRELWRSAAEALRAADRVALIGYSMPPTDLVTSGMLIDALGGRDVPVDVVNPDPDSLVSRLVAFGVAAGDITTVPTVEDYADELEGRTARKIADQLTTADPTRSLLVATSKDAAARVTAVHRTGDTVRLDIETVTDLHTTTRKLHNHDQLVVGTATLLEELKPGERIVVGYPHGDEAAIVSTGEWDTPIGLGDGRWTVLVPSAIVGPAR
jgi:hypothetical protein